MEFDKEIIDAFLQESNEGLESLETGLVELEENPTDPELLAKIFRTVHTIKGSSSFLGFTQLENLAHDGESLLGALRDRRVSLNPDVVDALLALVDAVRAMLANIEANGTDGVTSTQALSDRLKSLAETSDDSVAQETPATVPTGITPQTTTPATATESVADTSVRVNVDDLDSLMGLSAELIGVRSTLGDLLQGEEDTPLADAHNQLTRVTSRLQSDVMRARLQPIASIVDRYKRVARDLAVELHKHVHVDIAGEEVGVDRAINEALKDPLTHLVRNAIDHGIETPAERTSRGKDPVGHVSITCSQAHGRVLLEIADDGAGISPQTLRDTAVRKGLLDPHEAAALTDQQAIELIFLPGLSTSQVITQTSGRGVGMDSVRASLQPVGGSVDVSSTVGVGTTFRISVPLTVAIMPSLDIRCAGLHYAIPLANVEEVLSLTDEEFAELDNIDGALIFRLRGNLVPLVDLAGLLTTPGADGIAGRYLVVVGSQGRRFALVVDAVGESTDIVVKPLPYGIRRIPLFTGVTIRGSGQPSLILDIAGIASTVGITEHESVEMPIEPIVRHVSKETSMLLAGSPDGGKIAVRLTDVRRLEILNAGSIEHVGDRAVVQYTDGILPLLRVQDLLPERRKEPRGPVVESPLGIHVIVVDSSAGPVGLWVHTIDDIIAAEHVQRQPASRRGVSECVVLGDRVAEVLDVDALVAEAGIEARQ